QQRNHARASRPWSLVRKLPYLTVAVDDVFVTAQLSQTARSAGVELVGANADLRAEAEFKAVVEAGAGIHQDGGRIHFRGEATSRSQVSRNNSIGMTRPVAIDVVNRLLQILDHL